MGKDKAIAMLRFELKNLMEEWIGLERPFGPECPRCHQVSNPDDGGDWCAWHRALSVLEKTENA